MSTPARFLFRTLSRRSTALVAATTAAAVLLTGCDSGGGDTGALREDLDAQIESQEALRSQVRDLEQTLRSLQTDNDTGEAITGIGDRLEALEQKLSGIEGQLAEASTAREDLAGELRSGLADLESRVTSLEDAVGSLRTELQSLTEDVTLLEQRFETHLENHGG